ncbi:EAL domain-containing protein (putative c-di-GMP-specific phosphodiesterase class I)/GGDEF domain-containing protein [Pseudoxanthomonas japonensis]|uniref:EAL domain-containing protein n=1 Tax=Pseudoxanthomonas japonensis TaxID=69284 RepID=UPI0028590688|nr:EAL domain-containing protein [Pseudoxanthomonas japonensis]MDR7070984.1 EAL domain-containing protein (putative c-di-GMP-specific phosphodiesterase class I)/GGDEF domain-containing protein [Pseudoxanthomonas japonensis]
MQARYRAAPMLVSPLPDSLDALLDGALRPGGLRALFQPIVRLEDRQVVAHEGLMRHAHADVPPLRLLDRARTAGRLGELETHAARTLVQAFDFDRGGRLLINLSAHAILQGALRPQQVIESLHATGRDLSRFVIEITERDIVEDVDRLADALGYLRAAGIRIALDDFGNGHSNFELWHELGPEYVKIDRYLVHQIAQSPGRLSIVRALVQVADSLGTDLIAEGVERMQDLAIIQDLGIRFAQGYLLGRPNAAVTETAAEEVRQAIREKLPVWPLNGRRSAFPRVTAAHLLIEAPSISDQACNFDAEQLFRQHPQLPALPVVDHEGRPQGLINRRVFNERMAVPFARELLGRKPCIKLMHESPIMADVSQSIDAMSEILLGEDQRYLSDGFIITRDGRYAGVGTGEALVRRVTELRIEAARYANPLTLLPGNIPIAEHIARLIEARQSFMAAYCDLNHFKPYNDQYGYFRGDRMIRLVASTLTKHADPRWDFVGHVGGDDFVVLFQSDDWDRRCREMVGEFNAASRALFDDADVARGVLEGEDRAGRYATFPLTTLTIGATHVEPGRFSTAEEVASQAAAAKRHAKRLNVGLHVLAALDTQTA